MPMPRGGGPRCRDDLHSEQVLLLCDELPRFYGFADHESTASAHLNSRHQSETTADGAHIESAGGVATGRLDLQERATLDARCALVSGERNHDETLVKTARPEA